MTEIRMDVELGHPPERVWRALTDRELLPKWFAESDLEPRAGLVFRLEPISVPGLDALIEGELISLDEHRRISMRWRADELQTLMLWELTPTAEGCHLTLRESCIGEQWEPEHRAQLEESYRELLAVRLSAVLDWLAFREVDFAAAVPPVAGGRTRRRLVLLAAAAAAALAALTTGAIIATAEPDTTGRVSAAPGESLFGSAPATRSPVSGSSPRPARAVAATATPSPSTSPSRSPRPTTATALKAPAGPAVLAARYTTVSKRLFGYRGEITVTNSGGAAATGWVVTVTLSPGSSTVTGASGASYEQKGRKVTFTGSPVAGGGSLRFEFEVGGAPAGEDTPTSCAVNGQPCAGW